MKEPLDERSSLALAMAWASSVMAVSLEMVVPALLGHWMDRWLATGGVFLVIGAIVGLAAGMWHLIRLTQETPRPDQKNPNQRNRQ